MTTNHLTESDKRSVQTFLREWGYADLAEWALDNGYYVINTPKFYGWLDESDNHVDLEAECFRSIERQGELQDEARYG